MILLELPWPPSINHYWRRHGHITYVSSEGKQFAQDVMVAVVDQLEMAPLLESRLKVDLALSPPNRRKWDIDNRIKSSLDALTKACVWKDDSQIDELRVIRCDVVPEGRLLVQIEELPSGDGMKGE